MINADFHVHTHYSDGKESPKVMIDFARRKGIDIIAITDHDTTNAFKNLRKNEAIPGIEVSTKYGHIVLLCEFPPELNSNEIQFLIDYSNENNCVIFPSHPFDRFRKGIGNLVYNYKFDAVEIYNSKAPKNANKRAYEASLRLSLPGLSNSDAHVKEALGSAYNIIDADSTKVEDILESIRKGKVKIVTNGLEIRAKIKILEWYIQRKIESNILKSMRKM